MQTDSDNENIGGNENIVLSAPPLKKPKKNGTEFIMPVKENYSILLSQNYTVKQLKDIAVHYKIKLGGVSVKAELILKIYNFFKFYDNAVIIQRAWRQYLFKEYNALRGPARFKRHICVNETDFFTIDDIKDIPYEQFYSFKDIDDMVYGFDMMSIYNLFDKGYDKVTNPYNRNPFPKMVKKNMMKIIWFSRIFKDNIQLMMNNEAPSADTPIQQQQQNIEQRIISLFHDIDILGNYTNANWFISLGLHALIRFMVELNDIWTYRANLSEQVRREICPNHRELFRGMQTTDLHSLTIPILHNISLTTMEMLVKTGLNNDSRCLGANYVLCALTIVSPDAAIALPWLYQSVI